MPSLREAAGGRQRLADLLTEAAELEHGLLCQYLYAWFSMKRAPEEGVTWQQLELMRQWGASLLLVARQEMEHLGLVCNLLTAIGEAPTLRRPDFPLGPRYYDLGIPCLLEPFGLPALERFIGFEAPETASGEDLARFEQNRTADARHLLHRRALRARSARSSSTSTTRTCSSARRGLSSRLRRSSPCRSAACRPPTTRSTTCF